MKLLRNPVVVGLLALVAIGMVVRSLLPHLSRNSRRAAPQAGVSTAAPKAPPVLEKPTTSSATLTDGSASAAAPARLDLDIIHAAADRWAQGRRDPFQIRGTAVQPTYPPAREVLMLSAVWRQADSSLAVLNNRIYAAGDSVLRYTIKSIETDRVWVQGPNGKEMVEFKSVQATNIHPQQSISLGANTVRPAKP